MTLNESYLSSIYKKFFERNTPPSFKNGYLVAQELRGLVRGPLPEVRPPLLANPLYLPRGTPGE